MNRAQRRALKSNKKGMSLGRPEDLGLLVKQKVKKDTK